MAPVAMMVVRHPFDRSTPILLFLIHLTMSFRDSLCHLILHFPYFGIFYPGFCPLSRIGSCAKILTRFQWKEGIRTLLIYCNRHVSTFLESFCTSLPMKKCWEDSHKIPYFFPRTFGEGGGRDNLLSSQDGSPTFSQFLGYVIDGELSCLAHIDKSANQQGQEFAKAQSLFEHYFESDKLCPESL